jgi:hypothetical protein
MRVSATTACLDAQYGEAVGMMQCPAIDAVFTIEPLEL